MAPGPQQTAALLASTLASFITPFLGSALNIALPELAREFRLGAVMLSWMASAYLLPAAVFLVPLGRLADIWGRKKLFFSGTVMVASASLLAAASPSVFWLLAARVMQGIGSAMIFATSVPILISAYPPHERGRILGINTAAVYLGLSLGPVAGGFLVSRWGWRSIFLVVLPLCLALLVPWRRLAQDRTEAHGERFDFGGSLIYSLALVAVMAGFSLLPALWAGGLIVVGMLALGCFVRWEERIEHPVFHVDLLRNNRVFAYSNLAAMVNYSATAAVAFLLSLYLQQIRGLTPQAAGMILLVQPVVQALFSPLAGRLSDRIEPRQVASGGMAITVGGLILLTFLRSGTPLSFIVMNMALLGLGFAFFSSPNTNAVMSSVDKKFYGIGSATLGTMRLTGQMFSMGITALILALQFGRGRIVPASYLRFLGSMRTIFSICALLCVVGVFLSLARGRMR